MSSRPLLHITIQLCFKQKTKEPKEGEEWATVGHHEIISSITSFYIILGKGLNKNTFGKTRLLAL